MNDWNEEPRDPETHDVYSEINALNWSTLKLVHTSPKLCALRATVEREDTEAMALGRAIHCAVLEPDRWARDYCVTPDFGPIATKAGKVATNPKATAEYKERFAEWRRGLPASAQVIDAELHATVIHCADAIMSHRVAREALRGARHEQTIEWVEPTTGTACKARVDFITTRHVGDVKSHSAESVGAFLRDAEKRLYYAQLAWYHDGAILAGALPADADRPRILGVQTVEPFDVLCAHLSTRSLEAGRRLYQGLLAKYRECQSADLWPGFAPDLIEWDVSVRAAGAESEFADEEQW